MNFLRELLPKCVTLTFGAKFYYFYLFNNIKITISAGLASTSKHGYNLDVLMSKADINLYKSKALGKNRVTGDH